MSDSELKIIQINDNEIDDNIYIQRNCTQCNTCMKVNIKNLPRKDYFNECKKIYHAQ